MKLDLFLSDINNLNLYFIRLCINLYNKPVNKFEFYCQTFHCQINRRGSWYSFQKGQALSVNKFIPEFISIFFIFHDKIGLLSMAKFQFFKLKVVSIFLSNQQ